MAKTRRRWLRALTWAALFLVAALVGIWVAARHGPERLRREAEIALSEVLGETRVGAVELGWSRGPSISASDIQVLDEGEEALLLRRAELQLDLLQIFRGGGRFDRVRLEGLTLHLGLGPDGRTRPARIGEWWKAARDRGASPPADGLPRGGLRGLEIRDADIRVSRERPGDETATLLFRDVSLRAALGRRFRLEASARVDDGEIRFKAAGRAAEQTFNAALENTDLAGLSPWLQELLPELPALGGRIDARLRGRRREGALALDLFSIQLAGGRAGESELPLLSVSGRLQLAPDRLELSGLEASADELVLRGEAALPWPLRDESAVRAAIRTERLAIETLAHHATELGLLVDVVERDAIPRQASFEAVSLSARDVEWRALEAWLEDPLQCLFSRLGKN